eukprot:TRINITY_DN40350_c0_g1_i1.p1 TRINITY_DN40350_c0_g1~~TRINITY_DN40350_c0_g1_i1.p1  ORF type:complete len:391 (+),score=39.32 TRINITY_DN40350_c0_g1_i1:127-1299(+)
MADSTSENKAVPSLQLRGTAISASPSTSSRSPRSPRRRPASARQYSARDRDSDVLDTQRLNFGLPLGAKPVDTASLEPYDPPSIFSPRGARPSSTFTSMSARFKGPTVTAGPGDYVNSTSTFRCSQRPHSSFANTRPRFPDPPSGPGVGDYSLPATSFRVAARGSAPVPVTERRERLSFDPFGTRTDTSQLDSVAPASSFDVKKRPASAATFRSTSERFASNNWAVGPGEYQTPTTTFARNKVPSPSFKSRSERFEKQKDTPGVGEYSLPPALTFAKKGKPPALVRDRERVAFQGHSETSQVEGYVPVTDFDKRPSSASASFKSNSARFEATKDTPGAGDYSLPSSSFRATTGCSPSFKDQSARFAAPSVQGGPPLHLNNILCTRTHSAA